MPFFHSQITDRHSDRDMPIQLGSTQPKSLGAVYLIQQHLGKLTLGASEMALSCWLTMENSHEYIIGDRCSQQHQTTPQHHRWSHYFI